MEGEDIMSKINLENIVQFHQIGEASHQPLGDVVTNNKDSSYRRAAEDKEKTLLLAIDIQNDFMDKGALGVPGATKDVERLLQFMAKHFEDITHIMASLDTHKPQQIFHPSWWKDKNGEEPKPLTMITYEDIQSGKWIPKYEAEKSKNYVKKLEKTSKKQLCIWPYHCLKGSTGAAMEGQFAKLAYFHSVARDYELKTVVKGEDPLSEMYGIIQPEYSEKDLVRWDLIEEMKKYDKILIAGEAKSHCVLESIHQIIEHLKDEPKRLENLYVLTDCMSSIPGFEEETDREFTILSETYGIKLITSTDYK